MKKWVEIVLWFHTAYWALISDLQIYGSECLCLGQAKCCTLGGASDFHIRSHMFRIPFGPELGEIVVGLQVSSMAKT
jgi:hypothetical protein